MLSKSGDLVTIYNSIQEITKETGIKENLVLQSLKDENTFIKNYRYKYLTDYENDNIIDDEIWVKCDDLKLISNYGRFKYTSSNKITKGEYTLNNKRRIRINGKFVMVHCAVYMFFKLDGNDLPKGSFIKFIDKNADNTHIDNLNLEYRTREVVQFDLRGNLINIYESISQIFKINIDFNKKNSTKISAVCSGKRKTYENYIWKYLDDCEF